MAKTKTQPVAGSGLFDLGRIGESLVQQGQKTATRQQAQIDQAKTRQVLVSTARKEALATNDQARAASEETRNQQLEVLGGVNQQLDKARTAMALADSDNPLDRISLWMLQQSDSGYTREGNTQRIQYLQTASGALGDINVIQQQSFADEISRTQELLDMQMAENDDRFELIKLAEVQGQELIDAEVMAQNTRMGVIQSQASMQAQALSNMTDDQVKLAVQNAAQSKTQTVNVSGVEVPLARVQARAVEVEQLRYNESVLRNSSADMVLENLTMPELQEIESKALGNKKRTADVNGVSVPLGRVTDRIYNLNNMDASAQATQLGMQETQRTLLMRAQENALNTMLTPQLDAIIANGFVDPSTQLRYDPTLTRNTRDLKYDDMTKLAQGQALTQTLESPVSPAAQVQQSIQSILPNLQPNSPAATSLKQASSNLAFAASQIASGDPARMEIGMRLVQAAQENVDAQLGAEAKRLAAGDKDVEAAYNFALRGQQIPPDLIKSTLMERVKKGDYVGQWLTSSQNAIFVSTYNQAKFSLSQPVDGQVNQLSNEDIESQAAEMAVGAVMNQIAAPVSDTLLLMQANAGAAPNNPIHSVMSQTQFASLLKNADTMGINDYIAAAGVDAATATRIRAGQEVPKELAAAQNARLYMALEQKKPGLGDAYGEWWSGADPAAMVDAYTSSQMQAVGNDFTKRTELSLIMPVLKDSLGTYGVSYASGIQSVNQQKIQEEHASYVTFGNDPQTKQIFLLEQTPGLTTQEKQIAMQQIIQPILDITTAGGVRDPSQITLALESQLQNFEPNTPQARAVLGKLLKGRDAALKVIDDFIKINTGWNRIGNTEAMGNVRVGMTPQQSGFGAAAEPTNFDWYKQLQTSGVQTMNPGGR